MADLTVRPITDEDIKAYLLCLGTAFHFGREVSDERIAFMRERFTDVVRYGAFVDGDLSGTTGAFLTELTVPGGATVPCSAVTQVTVLPTQRRRGLLTEMMTVQLADAVEAGAIVAMLIAAEWPIYGRFGYGMAVEAAGTLLDARVAQFVDVSTSGSIELVDAQTFRAEAPAVFDRHCVTSAGAIARTDHVWDMYADIVLRPGDKPVKERIRAIHRDASGTADGYVVYDPNDKWEHNRPNVTLTADQLIATNDIAYRELWQLLCHTDWVTEVKATVRPVDESLGHLLVDGRAARQYDRSDHMWVRLLDVAAAMSARSYAAPVSLVLDVVDGFGDAGGRYALDADSTGATCARTDAGPDLRVSIDVLGATYLGGTRVWPFTVAGRVDELTPGAAETLDRALQTLHAPWATTGF
jgi:predicted acetyltransferase